jgi:hypothetical protein
LRAPLVIVNFNLWGEPWERLYIVHIAASTLTILEGIICLSPHDHHHDYLPVICQHV